MAERKVFGAIEAVEAKIEQAHIARQRKLEELLAEHLRLREPLLRRRYELVTGLSPPSDEELQGFAAAQASGSPSPGKAAKGMPFFWLNVLCNQPQLHPLITARDRCCLEYLEDVRYVRGPAGMVVEFHFADNPFFYNKVLRKGIYLRMGGTTGDEVEDVREEATAIDWKPARSLLHRQQAAAAPAAKPKQGAGGKKQKGNKAKAEAAAAAAAGGSASRHSRSKKGAPAPDLDDPEEEEVEEAEEQGEEESGAAAGGESGKLEPCASFFRFFLPITAGKPAAMDPTALEDEEDEEQQGDDEDDYWSDDDEADDQIGRADDDDEPYDEDDAHAQRLQRRRAARQGRDSMVLDILIKSVVPRAATLFLAAAPGGAKPAGSKGKAKRKDEDADGFELVSGSPAGDLSAMPLATQKILHALKAQQAQVDEMCDALKRAEWTALKEQLQEVDTLTKERRGLLLAQGANKLTVPAFWLRAFKSGDVTAAVVQARDERALSYLADARIEWDLSTMPTPDNPRRGATLELEFLPNPYFSNAVLRQRFGFSCPAGSINKLVVETYQPEPIGWKEGKDLTVRRVNGRPRPTASFFSMFRQGAQRAAAQMAGGQQNREAQAIELLEALLQELSNVTVNFAGRLARETPVDVDDLGDELIDEDDEEESDEDEEAEGSEDGEEGEGGRRRAGSKRGGEERAAAAAAAKAKKKRNEEDTDRSFLGMLKRNYVLAALVALVLLGQLLVAAELWQDVHAFVNRMLGL